MTFLDYITAGVLIVLGLWGAIWLFAPRKLWFVHGPSQTDSARAKRE
jgi:hypothetical protein